MQNEKKYFASANTEKGFVSFFNEIYGELDMVYIIKGGPGTGKSSFIRRIADEAENKRYSVEYFYCSADPLSLDGIIIEELNTAIIDGTAPHTYDPRYPGVKDMIIHLGDNWNGEVLQKNSQIICELVNTKSRLYNNVYNYLSAAGRIEAEIKLYNKRAVLYDKMQGAVERLTKGWKNGKGFSKKLRPVEGISHAGHIIYDTYHNFADNKYVVRDRYSIGSLFMNMILKKAESKGLKVVYSPSFLDTTNLSAIYLPEVSCSFVIGEDDDLNKKQINMDRFVDADILRKNKQKNRFARRCLNSLYEGVQKGFDEIYDVHTSLEKYYIEAMDFSKNADILKRIRKEIFKK